ncbi:bem46 [Symbiodinium sp. CCMP2592]|nr:bem46 [Symbiodinium sp. CCMP2592]
MPSFRVAAATAANSNDPEAPTAYCAQKRKCCCCELPRYAKCSVCLAAVYLALMPCVYLLGHFLVYPGSDFVATFHGTSCKQFVFAGRSGRSIQAAHCPLGTFGAPKNATPVVAFGGNGMNMYDVLLSMGSILPSSQQEWDLYSISFPGSQYAPNAGWTTQGRAEEDAQDLLQYVHNLTGRPVVVYGWSLGTSVAASLAAKKSDAVQCVLLGNPFTSIRDVALSWTKNFAWPYLYLVDEWPTARWAKQFRAPTIVMSSTQDQVVPQEMHRKIYETVPSEKLLVELPLQHMDIDGCLELKPVTDGGSVSLGVAPLLVSMVVPPLVFLLQDAMMDALGISPWPVRDVPAHPCAKLHSSRGGGNRKGSGKKAELRYLRLAARQTNGSRNVIFVTGDSGVDRWHAFRSNRIDAVVIDADHRYDSVLADISNALSVQTVKHFAFHDYQAPGVRQAITEFEELGALVNCQAIGAGWDGSAWYDDGWNAETETNVSEGRLCHRGKLGNLSPAFVNKTFYVYQTPIAEFRKEMDCLFLAGRMTCSTLQGSWSFRGEGRRLHVLLESPSGGALEVFFNKDYTAFIMGYLGSTYFGLQEGLAFMAVKQANRLFKDAKRQPL